MPAYKDPLKEAERRIREARESNARTLDLSSLNLSHIPEELIQLTNLATLNLSANQLSSISESLGQLTNLTDLDLEDNQLSTVPEVLERLTNLNSLRLGNNQITIIGESLGQLTNLTYLSLYNNQISIIPESLGQLANLIYLYLFDNQIKIIPDALSNLTNLTALNLSRNQIRAIPESLGQLTNLTILQLSGNQIRTIPDSLGHLTNLTAIRLTDNQIRTIPDTLGRLTHLIHLDLSGNQLSTLPGFLEKLPKLTALYLQGNRGLGIPDEVLGQRWLDVGSEEKKPKPPKEILDYYNNLADSRPLNEAKLILVGLGAVGKTSLIKALSTGKFKKGEKTTEGIKISDWLCSIGRNNKVKVHIWDFGGQEMMHATHQFFLTSRSLYLLVLNRRTGGCEREADYWFRLVRAFGGKDAPVIVVLNKQKTEPFDVNRSGWLEKYAGNIKGFVATDCEDQKSITDLKRKIQEELQQMQSLKASFPRRWFAIKDELSQMGSAFVTFDAYRDLCRRHKEEDPLQQNSLAGFLHDLGIALNYKDDLRLRFAYVLKPEWVTEGIYALLHAFVTSKGLFSPAHAEKVLTPKGYSSEAVLFIMGLMEKFELSFPLGDRQNRALIPQLLDDQQPEEAKNFTPAECMNFSYQYSIVPEGLLPRFIVRTHHLGEAATRWKSGVILSQSASGCQALIRSDVIEGLVRIHVQGPAAARPQLLAIIRHNFEAIHADYEFKPVELVYPPGMPDKPLQRDELEAFLRSGTATIPVMRDHTVINQSIAEVIEPVRSAPEPLNIFLSYAHKDAKYLDELRKDLKLMERNGLVRIWSDHELIAGQQWEPKILQELQAADVIICQLSRDFLASDFCTLKELEIAIQRKIAGEAELIAYVLKDCGWQQVPGLKQFQVLPPGVKPLTDWKKDKYWRAVAEGIQRVVENLQKNPRRRSGISRFVEAGM